STPDGDQIPIEERDQREVSHLGSSRLTPEGAHIRNPAFDVTPHRYITGIVTEGGILQPPHSESLKQAFANLARARRHARDTRRRLANKATKARRHKEDQKD